MPIVRHLAEWQDGPVKGERYKLRPLSGAEMQEAREIAARDQQRAYTQMIAGIPPEILATLDNLKESDAVKAHLAERAAARVSAEQASPDEELDAAIAALDGDTVLCGIVDWQGITTPDGAEVPFSEEDRAGLDATTRTWAIRWIVRASIRLAGEGSA